MRKDLPTRFEKFFRWRIAKILVIHVSGGLKISWWKYINEALLLKWHLNYTQSFVNSSTPQYSTIWIKFFFSPGKGYFLAENLNEPYFFTMKVEKAEIFWEFWIIRRILSNLEKITKYATYKNSDNFVEFLK